MLQRFVDRRTMRFPEASWLATRIVSVAVVVLLAAGCGPNGPAVEPVEGTVTLGGSPLEAATVLFSPAGAAGLPAAGSTGADGKFRLTTVAANAKGGAGAAVGDYVVMVRKIDAPPVVEVPTDHPDYGKMATSNTGQPPKIKYIVPASYGDPKTSPLKASVTKGANTFTFDIDPQAP